MANTEKVAGVDSYILYGAESTFGTAASTIESLFGLVQSFSHKPNRNLTANRGFVGSSGGGQGVQSFRPGKFEGSGKIDFQIYNWSFLQYVIGSRSGAGTGASPYVYAESNALTSLSISSNINNDTTDRECILLGTMFKTLSLKAEVGNPITASLEFAYADLDKDASIRTNQALPSGDVYNFSNATLEIPNATTISHVIDSIDVQIERNPEILYGMGSELGQSKINKARDYTINFTIKYLDETFIELVNGSTSGIGDQTATTLTLKMTNGTNVDTEFRFTGVYFPDIEEGHNLNEAITEGITARAKSLSVYEQVSA